MIMKTSEKEKRKEQWSLLDNKEDHERWGVSILPSNLLNKRELGLYATRDFKANEKIAPYLGEELSVEQRQERYGKLWGPYIYFKPWGHPSIDAQFYRGAAAFANDGAWIPLNEYDYVKRNPDLSNSRLERGYLVANKPIKAGSEILLNYGENYWKKRFFGIPEKGDWEPELLYPESLGLTPSFSTKVKIPKSSLKKSQYYQIGGNDFLSLNPQNPKSADKKSIKSKNKLNGSKIAKIEDKLMQLTPIQKKGNIYFKRDDLFEYAGNQGGKVRTCLAYILDNLENGIDGVVSGGSRSSPQVQIVGGLATDLGLKARLHLPKGVLPPYIEEACKNHTVKQWFPGYNHVISARVHEDTNSLNEQNSNSKWLEIPFGMEVEQAINLTAEQVKNIPFDDIDRIVIPVGSGMTLAGIIEGLKRYNPEFLENKEIIGVVVGQDPSKRLDRWTSQDASRDSSSGASKSSNKSNKISKKWQDYITLVDPGIDYHSPAAITNFRGIELDPIYEAKAIPFLKDHDLLWIVGKRH